MTPQSARSDGTAVRAAVLLVALLFTIAGCGGVTPSPSPDATATSAPEPFVVPFEPVLHCTEDDVMACIMLGRQDIDDTDDTWLRRLRAQADPVYFARLEDCSAGDDDACFEAGWLGVEGLTTVDVGELAWRLLVQTCEQGHERSCGTVLAGSQIPDRAAWAEHQCLQGDVLTCVRLWDFAYWRWDDAGRETAFDVTWAALACEQGFGPACTDLGNAFRWRTGDEPPNMEGALESYLRGCELGDADGCSRAGMTLEEHSPEGEPEPERVRYDQLACRMGDGSACSDAGRGLELGNGVAVDLPLARAHYEAGCNLGSWRACNNLALVIVAGRGGPVDQDAALDAWGRACAQGHHRACSNSGWYRFKLDGGRSVDDQLAVQADICAVDGTSQACLRLRTLARASSVPPEQFEPVRAALEASCLRGARLSCETGFGLVRDHVADTEFIVAASPFADVIRRLASAPDSALFNKLQRAWLDDTDPVRQRAILDRLLYNCRHEQGFGVCYLLTDLPREAMCTGRSLPDDPELRQSLIDGICQIYTGTPPCPDETATFTCP